MTTKKTKNTKATKSKTKKRGPSKSTLEWRERMARTKAIIAIEERLDIGLSDAVFEAACQAEGTAGEILDGWISSDAPTAAALTEEEKAIVMINIAERMLSNAIGVLDHARTSKRRVA
jgi:hypothetical protein